MTDDKNLNRDLMRGDADIAPAEFADDEAKEPDFGNWPEIVGFFATAILVWFSFAFRG